MKPHHHRGWLYDQKGWGLYYQEACHMALRQARCLHVVIIHPANLLVGSPGRRFVILPRNGIHTVIR